MAYTNGQIPDAALVSITGMAGARLRPGPAAAWEILRRAVFAAYGWYPTPTGISDAYRSYAVQESVFRARYTTSYLAGRPTKRWEGRTWYLLPGKATAATPGTSNHGLGITVDITGLGGFTGTRYLQLAAVAVPLGWSNAEGRSIGEAWHWTYTGPTEDASNPGDNTGTVPDGPNTNPIAPPQEADLDASQAAQLTDTTNRVANIETAIGAMQKVLADLGGSVLTGRHEQARIGTRLKEIEAAPTMIRGYYRRYLGREPVQPQLDARVAAIVNGQTLTQQRDAIQNSDEAKRYAAAQNS